MSIKKVGGLHHWRIGRLGGSFYLAKRAEPKGESMVPAYGFLALCFALAAAPHLI